jgi:Cytochrome c7 and related cytochrome c
MVRHYALFAALLVLALVVGSVANGPFATAGSVPEEGTASPPIVKFSHRKHVQEFEMDCLTCHPAAKESRLASDALNSGHDQCQTCHEEQIGGDCGYCHTSPDDIEPREPVVREILFPHAQHVAMEGVECRTCHSSVENAEELSDVKLPGMEACTTCHNDRKATSACENCHRNFVTLRPEDHGRSDFIRNHRDLGRLGGLTTECKTCHTETFCQQCHQASGLKTFTGKDLMSEPSAKTSTKDSPRQMILQSVHELNYRFIHGVDARARQAECVSCHEPQTFCAQCHEAGGNVTERRFKPTSHMVAGFTTLGAGSGGGLHAEAARRDIESCVSCHDVEGQDPVCLMCHTTTGSVR